MVTRALKMHSINCFCTKLTHYILPSSAHPKPGFNAGPETKAMYYFVLFATLWLFNKTLKLNLNEHLNDQF